MTAEKFYFDCDCEADHFGEFSSIEEAEREFDSSNGFCRNSIVYSFDEDGNKFTVLSRRESRP